MEIEQNDRRRSVYVWLTQKESKDIELMHRLQPMYAHWHEKKYMVAVFRSGTQDLKNNMADLLVYNRKALARQDLEQRQENRAV